MTSTSVKDEMRDSAAIGEAQANSRRTVFQKVEHSLTDLLGQDFVEAACEARAFLSGETKDELLSMAAEKVDFYPQALHDKLAALLPRVGSACCSAAQQRCAGGATSDAFRANSNASSAPLSCLGYLRLGENGRLFLSSKSAHYHASLGHCFPGYALIERAHRLGLPNATHNNTRGHVTRLVEEELVAHAEGIPRGDRAALDAALASLSPSVLNRVLNLETGSLAAEAAVKMTLARFYKLQPGDAEPPFAGRTPVLVVIGDEDGGLQANYHGTTVLTQLMRGMWPEFLDTIEKQGLLLVRSVKRDDFEELEAVFEEYDQAPYKIAGFFHELLLMNYGGKRLSEAFVQRMYALCEQHEVPTVVDEIQTCIWSPKIFMYHEYGVKPNIVVLGQGFPGRRICRIARSVQRSRGHPAAVWRFGHERARGVGVIGLLGHAALGRSQRRRNARRG